MICEMFPMFLSPSGNPGCHQPSIQNPGGDPTFCQEAARTAENQTSRGLHCDVKDVIVVFV